MTTGMKTGLSKLSAGELKQTAQMRNKSRSNAVTSTFNFLCVLLKLKMDFHKCKNSGLKGKEITYTVNSRWH